jgi:hypothetical protein
MPKPHTFPTLYNEALQIDISKLKGWGYLDPKQVKNGTITWSRNGDPIGEISIKGNSQNEQPFITLDYKYKGEPRNYKVYLTSTRSNLNKGLIWYFLCPKTKKRCRKLYSIGGYFLHRAAFEGCMYESQIQTKRSRELEKTFGEYFKSESLIITLHKKNFKRTYAGKPTKKYLRIMGQIQRTKNIQDQEFERAIFGTKKTEF